MPNESMVFYSSFSKAIKRLPEDEQLKALWSIIDYGIDGKEPEGDGLFMVAFDMAKPQIDANIKRKENGLKGGRKKTSGYENEKPMVLENETDGYENEKPNVNVNDNVNDNVNVNDNENVKTYTCAFESLWTAYPRKKEKAKAYRCYKARLADGFSEDELETAVKRYADECKINHTEEKYIKLGATFLGPNTPFTDYLGDWKPPEREQKQPKKNQFNNFHQRDYDFDDLERQLVGR